VSLLCLGWENGPSDGQSQGPVSSLLHVVLHD
jgi:hypothetical protein